MAVISVSAATSTSALGQFTQFTAVLKDAAGNLVNSSAVTWTSTDSTIIRVSSNGYALAVGVGTATVIAAVGSVQGQASETVTGPSIAAISINPPQATTRPGQAAQFIANLVDSVGSRITGRPVVWRSNAPSVLSVDFNGNATALSNGAAVVSAFSAGLTGSATVTVSDVAPSAPGTVGDLRVTAATDTSATLAFTQVSDGAGQPANYDLRSALAPISFAAASSVARGSCASPVAGTAVGSTVTCTVLGLSPSTSYNFQLVAFRGSLGSNPTIGGLSNIAAGATAQPAVASVTVSPSTWTMSIGGTGTPFSAILKDARGTVLSGRTVAWTSSAPTIVSVSATGLATGLALGTGVLTATSEGQSGSATITVGAAAPAPPTGPGASPTPGAVTDLRLITLTDTSAIVAFTQVSDGTGQPATYDMRFAVAPISWATAGSVTRGSCTTPISGSAIGAAVTCSVDGLLSSTNYGFQIVGLRGAVSGSPSNAVSGTTLPAAVASITLSPGVATVSAGPGGAQFTATLRDVNNNVLSGRPITWTSSDGSVATVSISGLATGVSVGTATITATSGGRGATASLGVTAPPPPATPLPGAIANLAVLAPTDTSVTLSFTQVDDGTGSPAKYDVRFQAGAITWVSATDVSRGTCAVPVNGTAIGSPLTCTVFGLSNATAYQFQAIAFRGTLNVNAVFGGLSNVAGGTTTLTPVATVTVSPASATANAGAGGTQFTATMRDAANNILTGRAVIWTSSNPAIATVSAAGLAAGVTAGGPVTISATSGGQTGTAALTVAPPPATPPSTVSNLSVVSTTDTSATLSLTQVDDGTGAAAKYDVRFQAGAISWGVATEVTRGTCSTPVNGTTIGATLTCTVFGLSSGAAYQFQAIAFRGTLNVNAVFGALSNIASGTTTLTAVASVTVTPASATANAGAGGTQFTATLRDASNNILTGRTITWTSSNPAVATISASGLATGVAAGTVTITANAGPSGTASLTVTVPATPPPGIVSNLSASAFTDTSATLSFTEVTDGVGGAASYDIRFQPAPISWNSATTVTRGTCATPRTGTAAGNTMTCTVNGLSPSTNYNFQVIAFRGTLFVNAVFGGLSNVAAGSTAIASVATVAVSPASNSVNVASTSGFTAILRDAVGNVLTGRPITWSSNNAGIASVSASGLATGVAAGSATISATSGGKSGAAALTVVVAPPPAPPLTGGGGSGSWPNEPGGMTTITDYGFTDLIPVAQFATVGSGWQEAYNTAGNASLFADASAPFSGPSVVQIKYPTGFVGGSAPATLYFPHSSKTQLYVGFWWKVSNPWQGHPSSVNKVLFAKLGTDQLVMTMYGTAAPYYLDMIPEFAGISPTYYRHSAGSPAVTLGVWHRVELFADRVTGVVKWWMDGTLLGSVTMPFNASGFSEFQFSPTWGGLGTAKAQNDYYWFDHVHISGVP